MGKSTFLFLAFLTCFISLSAVTGKTIIGASTVDNIIGTDRHVRNINCDMFECSPSVGGRLMAVVYDYKDGCRLKVWHSSFVGGVISITLENAQNPDVVIGDDTSALGNGYVVFVTYEGQFNRVTGQRYSFSNVAQPTFAYSVGAPFGFSRRGTIGTDPHVDLFPDSTIMVGGRPAYHHFVASYTQGLDSIFASYGEVRQPLNSLKYFIAKGTHSDVAATVNRANGNRIAYIAYRQNGTELRSINFSSSPVAPSSATIVSSNSFSKAPRIEAMNLNHPNVIAAKWQIVTSEYNLSSFFYDVNSYNDIVTSGENCTDSLGATNHLYPALAAGVGPSLNTSAIGNVSYVSAWFSKGDDNYSQYIDAASGTRLSPLDYYQLNLDTPGYGIALSSTTNTGEGILATWYDGINVRYKVTGNSSGYKPADIPLDKQPSFEIYPNPCKDVVYLKNGNADSYTIVNLNGSMVRKGAVEKGAINVQGLFPGGYIINLFSRNGDTKSVKIYKE